VSPFANQAQTPVPIRNQIAGNTPNGAGRSASLIGSQQQLNQIGANTYTQGPVKPDNAFLDGFRSAAASIEKALTIEPKVIPATDPTSLAGQTTVGPDLHYQAAKVYESQNNIPGAISHYRKALEMSPHDPRILVSFGRLYDGQRDLQRAEDLYQRALQVAPNDAKVENALGICYAKQGNLDVALVHLYRASQLQPQSTRYKNNMANVLCDAGRMDEAFAQLVSVHGEAGAHYNLGYMLFHQGKREAAQREFELALRANPYMEKARTMLNELEPNSNPIAISTPVHPASAKVEIPRQFSQFSVSEPFSPQAAKPGDVWPIRIPASKSFEGPHSLPAL
jgi:tetratricopeptide (TPR) repeat protein